MFPRIPIPHDTTLMARVSGVVPPKISSGLLNLRFSRLARGCQVYWFSCLRACLNMIAPKPLATVDMKYVASVAKTLRNSRFVLHARLLFCLGATVSLACIGTPEDLAGECLQSDSATVEAKLIKLRKSVAAATTPESTRDVLSEVLPLIDEALAADEYTLAIRIVNLAVDAAAKIGNPHVGAVCERRKTEVMNIGKDAKRIAKQFERLEKKPLEPAANFEVGRFKCVACNDWQCGLPLLARGNNANWSGLAKRDLAQPADVDSQVGIADDWGRLAVGEKGPGKLALALRARHWYRQAASKTTGAARAKIIGALERLPVAYLSDLDEIEVKAGPWPMGKNGDVGVGRPIEVNGFKSPMGIGLHPPENGEAAVKYKLTSSWTAFAVDVAVNDFSEPFTGSLVFVVLGDGEVLWKSPPVTSRGTVVSCKVGVKGSRRCS